MLEGDKSYEKKKASRVRGMDSNSNMGVGEMQFKIGQNLVRTCNLRRLKEVMEFKEQKNQNELQGQL